MRNGIHVENNIRWNTKVFYDREETNDFLKNNSDYELLYDNDTLKIYHCILKNDYGEVHDPKLKK